MPYQVLVVDDVFLMRFALEVFVDHGKEFELQHSLSSAEEAVDYCRCHRVDLILMDVFMDGGMDGIDAATRIKAACPGVKIILVSSMPEVDYLRRAREAGVESFCYKHTDEARFHEVMRRTMAGESIYPDHTPVRQLGTAKSTELTAAEYMVLRRVVAFRTNKEIAEELHISTETVKRHLSNMLQKTGYRSRQELALNAQRFGLVLVNEKKP